MKKTSINQLLIEHALDLLLIFIPVAAILHYSHAPELWTFIASGLAIIPLAGWMGRATEGLAHRMGAGVGGLLNATFGNAPELIIALIAVNEGLTEVVRGSLSGSVIGNLLLVLGASLVAGGKGALDRARCVEYWGEDVDVCSEFK